MYNVAAGGGGGFGYSTLSTNDYSGDGGHAGGIYGNLGNKSGLCYWKSATPASQTSGGEVGYCNGINSNYDGGIINEYNGKYGLGRSSKNASGAGGGGGFYGGASAHYVGGAGGSSYIGNSKLSNKKTYCYNCQESNDESTMSISVLDVSSTPTSEFAKSGNGYAIITLISID